MSDERSRAKLRAIAQFYRGGSVDPNILKGGMGDPDNSGNISGAPHQPLHPVQNVPAWAMHSASAPEGHSGAGTMDDMAAQRAAQLQQNNLASQPPALEPDLSGFTPYNEPAAPQPRQFPQIQAKMQSGQPVNTQDIRSMTSPTKALSPDEEAAVNKQLQSKDDEDEE